MAETDELLSHHRLEAQVNLANADWAEGRHAAAFSRYLDLASRRLWQAGHAADLTAADLVVLERLAGMATLFGHIERADSILAAMAELTGAVGNVCGMRYIELHRLHLALATGRLDAAHRLLDAMQQSWLGSLAAIKVTPEGLVAWDSRLAMAGCRREDRVVLLVRLHFALGWWLSANGQYRDALACIARAIDLARESGAPPEARAVVLSLRLRRAMTVLELGDLPECEAELAAIADDVTPGNRIAQRVEWLELRLRLALLRGDFGSALEYGGEIVRVCAHGGFARALSASRLNLAHALLLINQTRHATDLAEAVRTTPDLPAALAARAHLVQALAAARVRSSAEGLPPASVTQMWGRSNTDRQPEAETPPPALPPAAGFLDLFNDRATTFQWHLGQGKLGCSAASLRQMQQVFGDTDSMLIALRLGALGTFQSYYEGRLDDTRIGLERLLPQLRAAGLRGELWQMLRVAGWCAARAGRPPQEVQAFTGEADALLHAMGERLSPADRAAYLLNKWTEDEEVLAGLVDNLVAAKRRMQASVTLLRPYYAICVRRLIRALLDRVEDYRFKMAIGAGADGRIRTGRTAFPAADCALIVFLVLPDRVVVIRLVRRRIDFTVAPITRLDLRERVAAWHRALLAPETTLRDLGAIGAPASASLAAAEQTAMQLAQDLGLSALLADLPGCVRTVTFVPDDVLVGFPFAALRWRGRAMVEDSATSIAFTVDRIPHPTTAAADRAVLVAIAAGAPAGGGFPVVSPLPDTRNEIDTVAPWFARHVRAVVRLDDVGVDKTRVLAALSGAAFIHFASHGIFQPEAPHLSGLLLTPHGTRAELVSLAELSKLDFRATRHVTLSSCWSADSFVLPGRRILSLPETLWRAGAHSILACLWPVDDRAAITFMQRFYEHLNGLPRAEALRRTQCECLSGALGDHARDPFFWAGFVLYGETGLIGSPS
jgi:hypothetical protein